MAHKFTKSKKEANRHFKKAAEYFESTLAIDSGHWAAHINLVGLHASIAALRLFLSLHVSLCILRFSCFYRLLKPGMHAVTVTVSVTLAFLS